MKWANWIPIALLIAILVLWNVLQEMGTARYALTALLFALAGILGIVNFKKSRARGDLILSLIFYSLAIASLIYAAVVMF